MNEEKKLSRMLDEIFGDYINNRGGQKSLSNFQSKIETERFMPSGTNTTRKIGIVYDASENLEDLIEDMFKRKDIKIEKKYPSNSYFERKPVPTIAPPFKKTLSENNTIKNRNNSVKQAFIAKSICSQIYELFCVHDLLIKSSKRFKTSKRASLKTTIMEIKPLAEYVYEKIANQKIYYSDSNLRFNSESSAINFMERKINSILNDTAILKNSIGDVKMKNHLIHIQGALSSRL